MSNEHPVNNGILCTKTKFHKTPIIKYLGIKYHIRKELFQFTQIKCYYSIVDPAIKQHSVRGGETKGERELK